MLGSWRSGIQVPAHLRSGWYRLPARDKARPLLVVSAAGRFDPREVQVQWATDEQAASGHPGGSFQFADVGASPAWRNLRLRCRRSRPPPPRSGWSPTTKTWPRSIGLR